MTIQNGDLFGDRRTDKQRADALEMQARQRQIAGGPAETGDLPIFGAPEQIDLFSGAKK